MSRLLPIEDSKPWYRQFWPWFLILLPASVVVASLFTLYIANEGSDDLVVDDYYKNGLAINRQLEKKERAAEQGISAKFDFTGGRVTVIVAGPVSAERLQLLLSHPLESDMDFETTLQRIAPGQYQGPLRRSIAPRWHWTLELPGVEAWRLDGSVQAADLSDVASD